MSSDETYLEAFIESLSTLPHEVRRNLELMKDLDKACSTKSDDMRQLHQQYIHQAEEKMMQLETVEQEDGTHGVRTLQGDAVVVPTTEELMDYTYDADLYQRIQALHQECLQKADEKVAVARQAYEMIDTTVQRLDKDLACMEKLLQSTGSFHANVTAKPNDLAACQATPGSEWILAKVIQHDPNTGMYKLSDEDVESNKIFHLPEQQVVVLNTEVKLRAGDTVFAVYPDTTSFYQAAVVQPPRKQTGSYVMVNFMDDSDEFGVTHDKAVPLKHVMLPPYGSTIQ